MTDAEMIVALGVGLIVGAICGRWVEARRWRGKCDEGYADRAPVCSSGRFFYVVTEREYVRACLDGRKQ